MQAFGSYAKLVELDFEKGLNGQKFFLINGATGSGKTTILDAICYALYDKSSGSEKAVENLRSELVPFDIKTEVEFTFALGEKIYKIRRNPAQVMPKGTADIKKSAELYIDGELASCNSQEVDEIIKNRMGFNVEQFRQVVMLPQGKFRDFLTANSDKKMGILNLIFNSALYERIEKGLKEKADAAKIQKENLVNQKQNFFEQVRNISKVDGDINLSELIEKFSAEFADSKNKLEELKIQAEKAQNNFSAGKILDEQFKNFETAEKNFVAAEKELEKISSDFEKSKIEYEKRENENSLRNELNEKISELKKIQKSFAEYQNKKSALEKAETEEKSAKEKIQTLEATQKKCQERLEELRKNIDSLNGAEVKFKVAENDLKKSCNKQDNINELKRLEKELGNSQKRLSVAEKNYDDALKELNRLKLLQKMCTAASLAKNLQDGESCPVCGSTSHPNLAVTDEIIPTDEEIQQSEKFLDKKNIEKNSAVNGIATIKGKIAIQTAIIKKLSDVLDLDEAQKIFDVAKENFDKLTKDKKNLQSGESFTETKRLELEKAQQIFQNAVKNSANLRGVVETLKENIPAEYVDNPKKISDDLNKNIEEKNILDAAWEKAQKNFQKLSNLKSNQEGKIKSAETAKNDAAEKISGKVKPNIFELKKSADDAGNFYTDGVKKTSDFENKLKRLQEISSGLENVEKLLKTAEKNFQIWSRLSDTANAKNSAKMSFQTYYLNAMFQDVIREANERLEKMSVGRYQFKNMEGAKKHAKKAGLDLEILDAYTGKSRPVETLSGGESFLAALSLALGLAAVVKNSAGGINLDTIFIDEGFGSLDSETLDFAMSALTDLQNDSGRLIGIISHVEELKQRIPARLDVIKNKSGSTAKFI